MATKELNCAGCKKNMATLRDAKVRNGMIVYCEHCNDKMKHMLKLAVPAGKYMPDFMRGLFGG